MDNTIVGLRGFDAYNVALEFYRAVISVTRKLPRGHLVDQLERASESVALNVAEAHPATGADRARRFRIACDEASECIAALDLLEIAAHSRAHSSSRFAHSSIGSARCCGATLHNAPPGPHVAVKDGRGVSTSTGNWERSSRATASRGSVCVGRVEAVSSCDRPRFR